MFGTSARRPAASLAAASAGSGSRGTTRARRRATRCCVQPAMPGLRGCSASRQPAFIDCL